MSYNTCVAREEGLGEAKVCDLHVRARPVRDIIRGRVSAKSAWRIRVQLAQYLSLAHARHRHNSSVSFRDLTSDYTSVQMVRYSAVRCGTVRCGTVRYGTVRYGTIRCGTVRYGMVWYGMVR